MFFQQDWTWHLQNLVGCIYYRHLPHPNAPTKWPHLSLQSHQPRSTVEKSDQMPYTAWGQTSTSKHSGKAVWWCVQLRTPVALKAASVIWKQRSCKYHVCIYIYIFTYTHIYNTRVISKHNPNPRWCIQLLHFHVPLCHPHFVVRLFASTARSRESAADTASDSCPLRIAASQNQRLSKLLMEDESSHLKFH